MQSRRQTANTCLPGRPAAASWSLMSEHSRTIALLGSTGSIGKSTLDVVRESNGFLRVFALTANKKLDLLCSQAAEFQPQWVVATDPAEAARFDWSALPRTTKVLIGQE